VKFSFKPGEGWEKALVDSIQGAIAPYLVSAQGIVQSLRDDAYDYAQTLAADRLHTTAKKYIGALKKVEPAPDTWTITLGPEAVYLEEGYTGYDMIQAGLARGKASQYSEKTGRHYVRIPFEHVQAFAKGSHPMNPVKVQMGMPSMTGTTKGSMAEDLKRLKKIFAPNDPGITNYPGTTTPIKGKVWTIQKAPEGPQWEYRDFQGGMRNRMELNKQPSPLLSGITKVQYETGTGKMKSKYLTWRTATDPRIPMSVHSKPGWVHPGYGGAHIMKDVEQYINDEFAKRISELFQEG
jgi:hypothetical protein